MRADFEPAGEVRSVDLLAAFVSLWRERSSGTLRFERDGGTAGFDLIEGQVHRVFSSEPQIDTAAILGRSGKLDPGAIARVIVPEGSDAALAALQAGLLTRRDWRWGEKIRAIEVLSDLLGWIEGRYEFDRDARPKPGETQVAIPRLLLELFLRSRDRALIEHSLGPSDVPLVRGENFDGEFEGFGLTADAGAVVRLIDGRSSAAEISEIAPADEFAVLKLLAALTTLGLIRPADSMPAGVGKAGAASLSELEAQETDAEADGESDEVTETARGEPEETPSPLAEAESASLEMEASGADEPGQPPPQTLPFDVAPELFETLPTPETGEDVRELAAPPGPPATVGDVPVSERWPDSQDPPPARSSGALLGGLLALLFAAVAGVLLLRSRGCGSATPAGPVPEPTQDRLVVPRAETAAATPARARPTPLPSSRPTVAPTAHPTLLPTSRPAVAPTAHPTLLPTSRPAVAPTARPTPLPTSRPTIPPTARPTLLPTSRPTVAPTARPTPLPTLRPTVAPTARPTVVPTSRPTVAPLPTAAATGLSREDWLRRAERDRARIGRRGPRYAIQLELACELPTLEDAWKRDQPAGTMWLLASPFRGRTCFRVLWGRYATIEEARRAKPGVPAFFVTSDNHPAVVSVP